jgi:hypothetical protein
MSTVPSAFARALRARGLASGFFPATSETVLRFGHHKSVASRPPGARNGPQAPVLRFGHHTSVTSRNTGARNGPQAPAVP